MMRIERAILLRVFELFERSAFSFTQIAEACSISTSTVSDYYRKFKAANLTVAELDKKTTDEWEEIFYQAKENYKSDQEPDWDLILKETEKKYGTTQKEFEKYQEIYPNGYKRSRFFELVKKERLKRNLTSKLRRYPGYLIEVDFAGSQPWYFDTEGKKVKLCIFVATIDDSGKIFAFACRNQSTREWIRAHVAMFEFYGGVPEVVVCDNLKAAIIKLGKRRQLNRVYAALAKHYGFTVMNTRPRKPKDKARVERAVRIINERIFTDMRKLSFFSFDEAQNFISQKLFEINERSSKGGDCRNVRFDKLDKAKLKPNPKEPFQYFEWIKPRVVGRDCYLAVEGHYYSVPRKLFGKKLETKYNSDFIYFINEDDKELITHKRSYEDGGFTYIDSHIPENYKRWGACKHDFLDWADNIAASLITIVDLAYLNKEPIDKVAAEKCGKIRKLFDDTNDQSIFLEACNYATSKGRLSISATDIESLMRTKPWLTEVDEDYQLPIHPNIRPESDFSNRGIQL
ncbi:MAG: IS21 family transposase [Gammaproteobacteria bacterium]|nr:IS21 family transposase [Gammaproteobacteria bacterium]